MEVLKLSSNCKNFNRHMFSFKPSAKLPPGSLGIPFVGEANDFGKSPIQYLIDRIKLHGPVFKTRLYGERYVFVCGATELVNFLESKDRVCVSNAEAYKKLGLVEMLGNSILFADCLEEKERFEMLREKVSSAFTPAALERFYPVLLETAQELHHKELLRQAPRDIELYKFFKESLGVVLHRLVLGIRYTHERAHAVRRLTSLHYRGATAAFMPLKLGYGRVTQESAGKSKEGLLEAIDRSIEDLDNGLLDDRDTIMKEWLRDVKTRGTGETGEGGKACWGIEEVRQHMLLLLNGYIPKALASVLTNLCMELGRPGNSRMLKRIRRKVQEVDAQGCGVDPRTPLKHPMARYCLSELDFAGSPNSLRLLDAALCEIFRLYPPCFAVIKGVKADVKLDKYYVPAGWKICFTNTLINIDPTVWPLPNQFLPERWLDASNPPPSYLLEQILDGYPGNKSSLPGGGFALMLLRHYAVDTIRRFDWTPVERHSISLKWFPVPRPLDNYKVHLRAASARTPEDEELDPVTPTVDTHMRSDAVDLSAVSVEVR